MKNLNYCFMGLSSDNKTSLIGAGVSAGAGLIGSALGFASGKLNYNYNKKLMSLQNQYNIDAFNRENERQDWLLQNQALLNKIGLKKAGYSTADPNGTGFSAGSMNTQEGPSIPGGANFDFGSPFAQVASTYASIRNASAQADLAEANAKIANIEADKRAEVLQTNIDKVRADIKAIQEKLPEEVNLLREQVNVAVSQKNLNEKTGQKIDQEITNLQELVKGIKIDNRYKPLVNDAEIGKMWAEAYHAHQTGHYQYLVNQLANHGILINADGMTNLLNILLNHPELPEEVVTGVTNFVGTIPGIGPIIQWGVDKLKERGIISDAKPEDLPDYEPPQNDDPYENYESYLRARDEYVKKKGHVSSIGDLDDDRREELMDKWYKDHPFDSRTGRW